MTFTATISSKNQITIPVALLRQLDLKPGNKIVFEKVDSDIKVRPVKTSVVDDIVKKYKSVTIPSHLKGKSWKVIKKIADGEYTKYLVEKYHIKIKKK